MDNKYCNLTNSGKIKDDFPKINDGFGSVESDINSLNTRVNNIVSYSGSSNQEIVDARVSSTKQRTFATLGARVDDIEVKGINFPLAWIKWQDSLSNVPASTTLSWDSGLFDEKGMFNAENPTVITCPANCSGLYMVNVSVHWEEVSAGSAKIELIHSKLNPEGYTITMAQDIKTVISGQNMLNLSLTGFVPFYPTDTLKVSLTHSLTGNNPNICKGQYGLLTSFLAQCIYKF